MLNNYAFSAQNDPTVTTRRKTQLKPKPTWTSESLIIKPPGDLELLFLEHGRNMYRCSQVPKNFNLH